MKLKNIIGQIKELITKVKPIIFSNFVQYFFYSLVILFVVIETITYRSFFFINTNFSINRIFAVAACFFILVVLSGASINEKIKKINNVFFCLFLPFFFLLPILDKLYFPNYVFSHWNINFYAIQSLILFFFLIILINNMKLQKFVVQLILKIKNKLSQFKWKNFFGFVKKILCQYWIYLFIFIFLLSILYLTPSTADMLITESFFKESNFLTYLFNTTIGQITLGGRAFASLVSEFLFFKFGLGFDILYAFNITFLILLSCLLFRFNKKIATICLFFLMLLLLSGGVFESVLLYANAAYITPILLILIFLLVNNKYKIIENQSHSFLFYLLAFLIGNSMEHIGAGFFTSLFLWLVIDWKRTKKINLSLLYVVLAAGLGFFYTILGIFILNTKAIIGREITQKTDIIELLATNFKLFFDYVIITNNNIFAIGSIIIAVSLIQKKIQSKTNFVIYFLITYFLLAALLLFSFNRFNLSLFDNALFSLLFWLTYFISLIVVVFLSRQFLIQFLFSIAIFSVPPILASSYLADRTISIVIFVFIIIVVAIFDQLYWSKKMLQLVTLLTAVILTRRGIVLFETYYPYYVVQKKREIIIEEVVFMQNNFTWDYQKEIVLPNFPEEDIWGAPNHIKSDYYYPFLIKNYSLDEKTLIIYE